MSIETGGSAFPLPAHIKELGPGLHPMYCNAELGMTLRDYFAAHAPEMPEDFYESLAAKCTYVNDSLAKAIWSFQYADDMLKARNG